MVVASLNGHWKCVFGLPVSVVGRGKRELGLQRAFSKVNEQCLSATLLSPEVEFLRNLHSLHSFPFLYLANFCP